MKVVFHNCEPERHALVISVDGVPASAMQLDFICMLLNSLTTTQHLLTAGVEALPKEDA